MARQDAKSQRLNTLLRLCSYLANSLNEFKTTDSQMIVCVFLYIVY